MLTCASASTLAASAGSSHFVTPNVATTASAAAPMTSGATRRGAGTGRRCRGQGVSGGQRLGGVAHQEAHDGDVRQALRAVLDEAALEQDAHRGREIRGQPRPIRLVADDRGERIRDRPRPRTSWSPSASRRARTRTPTRPCACRRAFRGPAPGSCTPRCRGSSRSRSPRSSWSEGASASRSARRAEPSPTTAFARPKSRTFTLPSGVSLTLAGLRSRWTMPLSCASARASAICFAIARLSSIGIRPRFNRSREVFAFDELQDQVQRVACRPRARRSPRRSGD